MVLIKRRRESLASQALILKKAWLFTMAWLGQGANMTVSDLTIPNYSLWPKKQLKSHIDDLTDDLTNNLEYIVKKVNPDKLYLLASWMSSQLDRWKKSNCGILLICTAQEFEKKFGLLRARDFKEVPPYAELLIQGWHGLALRHPEYMLARDLEFMYSLFCDSESIVEKSTKGLKLPAHARYGSENSQTLARIVILTCFNLLESFVSGLVQEYLMTATNPDKASFDNMEKKNMSLKKRILFVPKIITGKDCGLEEEKPPISTLFVQIKPRRDSFVHCVPGPNPSRYGVVKEELFHDVSKQLVDECVDLTLLVIRHIWKHIHATDSPRWLKDVRCAEDLSNNLHLSI